MLRTKYEVTAYTETGAVYDRQVYTQKSWAVTDARRWMEQHAYVTLRKVWETVEEGQVRRG